MAYLGSTNSAFAPRPPSVRLPMPLQYNYVQSSDSATSTAGSYIPMRRAMFTLDAAGSTNVVDDLFTADNGSAAVIRIPLTGIWCVSWTQRFNAYSSENATWFTVNSPFYKETFGGRRLGATSTASSGSNTTITSYFDVGDLVGLLAYSGAATNKMNNTWSYLTLTLVQQTATRPGATPIVPVIVS